MNNIYLISRTDTVDYDEYDAVVIIAESENLAKDSVINKTNYNILYGQSFKTDNITCELIGMADKDQEIGVVLSSFNAG
jgi:hypothetical protein